MSTQALADDPPYTPKNFSSCKVFKTSAGKEVCGFENIDDWKLILTADADLVYVREQLKNEQLRTINLSEQKTLLQAQVDAANANQKLLVEQNSKLTNDLIGLDKKYQDERVKPTWGSPVAWTIAGVSTSVLVGFVLYSLLN